MARERVYALPSIILGPADINRTIIELKQLGEYIRQLALHKDAEVKLPKTTVSLQGLAEANKIDLLNHDDRELLVEFLESLQKGAPVLHISFASEASPLFVSHIVEWLRSNVSRYALVQVGLQPSIAAGCIVRSTNKVFDMSLRRHLRQNRDMMIEQLHRVRDRDNKAEGPAATEPPIPVKTEAVDKTNKNQVQPA